MDEQTGSSSPSGGVDEVTNVTPAALFVDANRSLIRELSELGRDLREVVDVERAPELIEMGQAFLVLRCAIERRPLPDGPVDDVMIAASSAIDLVFALTEVSDAMIRRATDLAQHP